jgi:hypothetical protein
LATVRAQLSPDSRRPSLMKRLAVLAVPAAAAVGAIALLPGAGSAQQGDTGQTIKLVESGNGPFKFIDNPPKVTRKRGPSAGDSFIFANKLTDSSGKPAGTLTATCEVTPSVNSLLCTGVFKLVNGTITGTALTTENGRKTTIAITGGTGAYEGARGSVESVARSSKQNAPSDDTIHLLG